MPGLMFYVLGSLSAIGYGPGARAMRMPLEFQVILPMCSTRVPPRALAGLLHLDALCPNGQALQVPFGYGP